MEILYEGSVLFGLPAWPPPLGEHVPTCSPAAGHPGDLCGMVISFECDAAAVADFARAGDFKACDDAVYNGQASFVVK